MDIPETIKLISSFPHIDPDIKKLFLIRLAVGQPFVKGEGASEHVNVFFLPFNKEANKAYLGWHIKADDWIPPGGHIEPGETPVEAVIREMKEELGVEITKSQLEPFDFSIKAIGRPEKGCVTHYDLWYIVHTPVSNFTFLPSEYHDAAWFPLSDAIAKIAKNPDFATIVAKLTNYPF
ncbi:MAG: NUDIX domain-containing protein [bacterium]